MTRAASGDGAYLVFGGTATSQRWRGGRGVLMVQGLSGTPNFEIQMPDGSNWITVKDCMTGAAVSAIAADGMFQFELPACTLRMSAGGGSMNCYIVGV
jgi:hypothetical protein